MIILVQQMTTETWVGVDGYPSRVHITRTAHVPEGGLPGTPVGLRWMALHREFLWCVFRLLVGICLPADSEGLCSSL